MPDKHDEFECLYEEIEWCLYWMDMEFGPEVIYNEDYSWLDSLLDRYDIGERSSELLEEMRNGYATISRTLRPI